MSDLDTLKESLVEASVDACWRQWDALGAMAASARVPRAQIDPEALLLLSFTMSRFERRLTDMWRWWATVGSELTSIQRLTGMAGRFSGIDEQLAGFASTAVASGNRRWKKYSGPETVEFDRALKGPDEPTLRLPSALVIRMRAGIGLGARAEILSFLLGTSPRESTISQIAEATGYTPQAVRVATGDLVLARFAREIEGRPTRIGVDADAWSKLLLQGPPGSARRWPRWRYWSEVFALLAAAIHWLETTDSATAYIRSSRARDLLESHRRAIDLSRMRLPDSTAYKGEDLLPVFLGFLETLPEWVNRHL